MAQTRVSRSTGVAVNLAKSVVYTAILWAACLFAIPAGLAQLEHHPPLRWARFDAGPAIWAALLIFWAAAGLAFSAAIVLVRHGLGTPLPLDATRRLVVAGPYRHIRNPMAAAAIVQAVAVGIWLGSGLTLIYAVASALIWHGLVRPWEEGDLQRRFGAEYDAYRAAVPCWRWRATPYRP